MVVVVPLSLVTSAVFITSSLVLAVAPSITDAEEVPIVEVDEFECELF